MELTVRGRNLEVPEEVRYYADRKIRRLSRHLKDLSGAVVELSRQTAKDFDQRIVAQVTLNSRGTFIRAEERASNLIKAVDAVAATLDRRIERHKGRLYRQGLYKKGKARANASLLRQQGSAEEEPPELEMGPIVRIKTYAIKPMSQEEALEQMELLGHDFFLFINEATDGYNLLYRRKGGGFGLIQPGLT